MVQLHLKGKRIQEQADWWNTWKLPNSAFSKHERMSLWQCSSWGNIQNHKTEFVRGRCFSTLEELNLELSSIYYRLYGTSSTKICPLVPPPVPLFPPVCHPTCGMVGALTIKWMSSINVYLSPIPCSPLYWKRLAIRKESPANRNWASTNPLPSTQNVRLFMSYHMMYSQLYSALLEIFQTHHLLFSS